VNRMVYFTGSVRIMRGQPWIMPLQIIALDLRYFSQQEVELSSADRLFFHIFQKRHGSGLTFELVKPFQKS
jgi:hypothetical protein